MVVIGKTTKLSDPLVEVDEMQAVYSFSVQRVYRFSVQRVYRFSVQRVYSFSVQRELKSTVTTINFLWYTGAGQDFTVIARWWT